MVVTIDRCCYKCHRMPNWNCPRLNCKLLKSNSSPLTSGICGRNDGHPRNVLWSALPELSKFLFSNSQNVQHLCKLALVEKWKKFQTSPYWCLGATTSHINNYFSFPLIFVDRFTRLHGCICYKINQKYLLYLSILKPLWKHNFHFNLKS